MRTLTAALLLLVMGVGCDTPLVDSGDGLVDGGPADGGVTVGPIPEVSLEQIQVKGFMRSDWMPGELPLELQPEAFIGIERDRLPLQLENWGARVLHLGFHLRSRDFRAGLRGGYFFGAQPETFCGYFEQCFENLPRADGNIDWVGPIFILLEHIPNPALGALDEEQADALSAAEKAQLGYPYRDYIYQIELTADFVPRERVFAPSDLRGDHPTLRDAIREDGWPSLEALDGKFIFVIIDHGGLRDDYLAESWRGAFGFGPDDPRAFVVADSPDDDHAAFFSFSGPESVADAREMARQGFMVHAAAEDEELIQRYAAAGAHLLTPVLLDQTGFDTAERCNPVTAELRCYGEHGPPPDVLGAGSP